MRRFISTLLIAGLTMGTLAGCGSASTDSTEATEAASSGSLTSVVALGEFDPQISGQQVIAAEMGYFEEEGLDVDLQLLTDPSVSTTMIASNEAQFYSVSNYQAINLVDKGTDVCLLAPTVNAGNTQVVVAGKDSGIVNAKDMEGKKMGYTDGAGVIVAVKNMCDDLGVNFDAIELVNLQASDMLASLESGEIDCFAAWEPWGIKAEDEGAYVLFTGTKSYFPENEGDVNYLDFMVAINANREYVEENPEVAQAYVRAIMKATDYINENKEDAAAIIAEEINLDTDTCLSIMEKNDYKVAYDQTFKDSCDSLSAYMTESGLNTSLVTFDQFAYTDTLSAIDASLVSYK